MIWKWNSWFSILNNEVSLLRLWQQWWKPEMMNCPECGNAAHTRSSFQVSKTTKERYNQCQNINCGCTFVTHETFVRHIAKPNVISSAPPHPMRDGQEKFVFEA